MGDSEGLPVTRENVLRALRAAGIGGGSPTEEDGMCVETAAKVG